MTAAPAEPARDCPFCPRLVAFRELHRAREPAWHNAPVPSFGAAGARLLIVGLAPGLRGANRTGRPFTGDWAGDLLYPTLIRHGLAVGQFLARPDDGLALAGCRITNAVRCVPPENKPTPAEVKTCLPFLAGEIAALPTGGGILALGRIAHDAVLTTLKIRKADFPFAHGAMHELPGGRWMAESYHCSRYNTNTGRLTPEMFDAVVGAVVARIG
ncbi:uracil-DNA glycosylase family 4 [Stella humosa]|uniref:Type-5 uracil-DNA glycosylase n=1 Tax=Stella humosa TaxID=94 RepID=A0A3N1KLJ7_9PROT|nr:uracil-DNA glycosylase [Stella humosa]ROP81244.1 uracil-DNA glycosylase family 4 [Stella humosa]BBK32592.1 uracil-DNA glycosylase [Stella humosa]